MKTTMMFRSMANPRRTTLAHLTDEDAPGTQDPREQGLGQHGAQAEPAGSDEQPAPLPMNTANPRRTMLVEAPATSAG